MENQQTNETPQQLPIEDQMPDWFSLDDFSPEPHGEPQSEPKQEQPQTDERRELTYGEKLVGITFNPSNNKDVDRVKRLCAELADIAHHHFNSEDAHSNLQHHLYIHTIGEILNAQMNVVKLITFKY